MTGKRVAAIDAGVSGALALLDTATDELTVHDLPINPDHQLDTAAYFSILLDWEPTHCFVEDCWRPKTLVRMVGEVMAVAKILQAEIQTVAVVTWKIASLGHNTSVKAESINRCKTLRPDAQLRRTPRCRTDSADRAEAVLLALYARDHLLD